MDTSSAKAEPIEARRSGAWLLVPYVFTLTLVAAQCGAIAWLNGGHFTYSIDDPYIHLALSENIAQGHYGINLSEKSAPSSNIAWPVLMAATATLPFHEFTPLAVGILATLGCVAIFLALMKRTGLTKGPQGPLLAAGFACIAVLGLNFIGVLFTGMEHPLQFFLSLAAILGLAKVFEEGRFPWWLGPVLVLGPLIRYENAAISVAALIVLVFRRRFVAAFATAVVLGLIIGAYSLMLHRFGLPPLASSILVHSEVAQSALDTGGTGGAIVAKLKTLAVNMKDVVYGAEGRLVAVMGVVLLVQWLTDLRHPLSLMRLFGAMAILASLVGMKSGGSFFRYETNILIFALAAILYSNSHLLARLGATEKPKRVLALAAVLVMTLWCRYTYEMIQAPMGANNIHEQQYQMHRFAVDYYKAPIGVNDLGWTSYQNPEYVLDLWGLASNEAREMRMAENKETDWMATMTAKHDVGLVMIFESWFGEDIPASWQKVAALRLGGPKVTTAGDTVAFFVTDEGNANDVLTQLKAFKPTLPEGVGLDIFAEAIEEEPPPLDTTPPLDSGEDDPNTNSQELN